MAAVEKTMRNKEITKIKVNCTQKTPQKVKVRASNRFNKIGDAK